jgi:hypothetical protein
MKRKRMTKRMTNGRIDCTGERILAQLLHILVGQLSGTAKTRVTRGTSETKGSEKRISKEEVTNG